MDLLDLSICSFISAISLYSSYSFLFFSFSIFINLSTSSFYLRCLMISGDLSDMGFKLAFCRIFRDCSFSALKFLMFLSLSILYFFLKLSFLFSYYLCLLNRACPRGLGFGWAGFFVGGLGGGAGASW